ncbi:MAG: TolC family protein [Bdellovibrionota bacterium]
MFSLARVPAADAAELVFDQLIDLVLGNNADVRLAALDYKVARSEIEAGLTDFDTLLTVRPEYRDERQLSNSTLESANYHDTTGSISFGLKKKFSLGTQGELVFQELWLTSDSLQSTFGDRDQAALQVKVTQPLLRGRGRDVAETSYRKATFKADRYRAELEGAINDAVMKAIGLHLELAQANIEVQFKRDEVEYYRTRKEEAEARVKAGMIVASDGLAIQARFQVAVAESLLAEAKATEARDGLLREITAAEANRSTVPPLLSEEELLRVPASLPVTSTSLHPSIASVRAQGLETSADLEKARNALYPQLDLSLQGSSVGAGSNHSQAEEGWMSGRTPSWQILLSLSWPIGNDAAKGEFARLGAENMTRETSLGRQALEIEKQRVSTSRELAGLRKILERIVQRSTRAEKISDAKQAQFRVGRLDAADFIRARNDYSEAKLDALKAAIKLRKSMLKTGALENRLVSSERRERFLRSLE